MSLVMLYTTAVGALLGCFALAAERVALATARPRRWGWAVALALALVLPAGRLLWSARTLAEAAKQPSPLSQGRARVTDSAAGARWVAGALDSGWQRLADGVAARSLDGPLTAVWVCATLVILSGYAVGVHRLAGRRRRWRETAVAGVPVLVASGSGPAVVGALRPRIVLPEWALSLDAEQRAMVLAHEQEHVRAGDPLLAHLAALSVALVPWNLAGWWMLGRLRLALEIDCDARVLERREGTTHSGLARRSYGDLLLTVAEHHSGVLPAIAPALLERPSSLSRRILAMQPTRIHRPAIQAALSTAIAAFLLFAACKAPSPEVLAPDGQQHAKTRLVGPADQAGLARADSIKTAEFSRLQGPDSVAALVTRYFPDVLRGQTGPSILFVVRDAKGAVVRTSRSDAPQKTRDREKIGGTPPPPPPPSAELVSGTVAKVADERAARVPRAFADLAPGQIRTVDVSKYKAGTFGPNPVSVVMVSLK